jgi:hypothetical protein
MVKDYELLKAIEAKVNKLAYNAIKINRFDEVNDNCNSHLSINRRRWDALMEELRGWSVYQGSTVTKESWIEYCEKSGLNANYTFGDIMA